MDSQPEVIRHASTALIIMPQFLAVRNVTLMPEFDGGKPALIHKHFI